MTGRPQGGVQVRLVDVGAPVVEWRRRVGDEFGHRANETDRESFAGHLFSPPRDEAGAAPRQWARSAHHPRSVLLVPVPVNARLTAALCV
jgi:hypothetical protein